MIDTSKYRFYFNKHIVVAVSSFAGNKVRGVAKCCPNDEFNLERGKEIAAARCGEKIAAKRVKRAYDKVDAAKAALDYAIHEYEKAMAYQVNAETAYNEARFDLENVMSCYR